MLLPRPEAAVAQENTGTPQATPGAVLSATSAITTITLGDEVTIDGEGAAVSELGVVIATGARLSVPVATSAQASVVVTFDAPHAADTLVVIRNQDGEDVLVVAPAIAYQQLLYSDAGLADDVTYTVYSGGEGEAGDGRLTAPVMNPGTEVTTITTESVEEARLRRPGGPPPAKVARRRTPLRPRMNVPMVNGWRVLPDSSPGSRPVAPVREAETGVRNAHPGLARSYFLMKGALV